MSQTTEMPTPEKKVKDLTFNIERSIRYHSRRRAFFETFDAVVNTTNLILGSAAVAGLASDTLANWFLGILSASVAVVSFINLTMRSSEKASLHSQLQQRYIELLKKIKRLEVSVGTFDRAFNRCEQGRLDIERDEPPIYRVVDLLAYNEQARAQGAPDTHIWVIPREMAIFANFWRFETDDIKSLAESRSSSAKDHR